MAYYSADSTAPAKRANPVTTSDSTVLECTRALWVGGAGDVTVTMALPLVGATAVTFSGVPSGTLLPVQAVKVMATGTTATLILALY